jgi:hypothetical protein
MHAPIKSHVELFSRDPRAPITRKPYVEVFAKDPSRVVERGNVRVAKGTFFVLVREIPQASSVVLFSSPLDPREAAGRHGPSSASLYVVDPVRAERRS